MVQASSSPGIDRFQQSVAHTSGLRLRSLRRRGATLVEGAIVLPIVVLMIIGILVVGFGVFRYQQMVTLASEGARYACVRGSLYASETGNSAASATDVYNNAIVPMAVGLDLQSLSYSVNWPNGKMPTYADPNANPANSQALSANVVVTVSYAWIPERYFGGLTLTGTATMPMQY